MIFPTPENKQGCIRGILFPISRWLLIIKMRLWNSSRHQTNIIMNYISFVIQQQEKAPCFHLTTSFSNRSIIDNWIKHKPIFSLLNFSIWRNQTLIYEDRFFLFLWRSNQRSYVEIKEILSNHKININHVIFFFYPCTMIWQLYSTTPPISLYENHNHWVSLFNENWKHEAFIWSRNDYQLSLNYTRWPLS